MNQQLRIGSYFSISTDLAAEMRAWPEFIRGEGYDVELRNPHTGEAVSVCYVESGAEAHVFITASGAGSLFDRVAGRVIYALSAHTDTLWIDRHVPDSYR